MPKIIAIQDDLKPLGKELEARGYEVVDENYAKEVDAILYDSNHSSLSYLENFDNVIDMDRGALIINVANKNIQDIIYAIEKRAYESLF
ncbi:YkuS family protein [Anaerophilus nitritogenes]|uniref:YkuS family protein n=1 Tax=Anaerophilus nitritogenes TaxID=2498136 RepID=UPI00101D1480|nr:YkuS family protein [Anaerophilus nitritogenes]